MKRVAALYDIHGNLPALEAVLDDVQAARVDAVVVGGDVLPGPMPNECLRRLLELDVPTHFLHGNGDLAILAQIDAARTGELAYWGTSSGARPPESVVAVFQWSAAELELAHAAVIARWPRTVELDIAGLGRVMFSHSTPRSETESFTRLTPEERLAPIFEPLSPSVFVGGHTHMQFDRRVGSKRVVNAGSVGMPFAEPGAYWLLLGPEMQLRRTDYDLDRAAARIRGTAYPGAAGFASGNVLSPPSEETMLKAFAAFDLSP
ncbi:MAG: metallophosphoesterase family protein [Gemmatimonadaceae bacterium]